MPDIPNTNANGLSLLSQGNGSNASYWGTPPTTSLSSVQVPISYMVPGLIKVAVGATNYLPPFYFPVEYGQTATLVQVIGSIRTTFPATVNLDIQQNGSTVAGLSGITLYNGGVPYTPTGTISVANDDYFQPVVTSIASLPDGLSLTFYFQVSP